MRATTSTLRDAIAVAAIAVLTVQGLRRWYGDRYLVPSDSMQPLLYGDPGRGDVVFVRKHVAVDSVSRGDVVVVENPDRAGHQLVKRIAASGDERRCWIDIRNGDVWLGEDPQRMQRDVKEPLPAMARSVPWARAGGTNAERDGLDLTAASGDAGGPWTLPPAAPSIGGVRSAFRPRAHRIRHRRGGVLPDGAVGTAIPVDATYVDAERARSSGGREVPVVDCGMSLRFVEPPQALALSIDSTATLVTLVWDAARNRVVVWHDGKVVHERTDVLPAPWRGRVDFGRLDGRDFVILDGRHELVVDAPKVPGLPRPQTWLHAVVVGDRAARFDLLHVYRDVYAWRQPDLGSSWPRFVEPGHWFLLGDNAFDSRDSRQIGTVPKDLFLGVPCCVIGPWSRRRMLP